MKSIISVSFVQFTAVFGSRCAHMEVCLVVFTLLGAAGI